MNDHDFYEGQQPQADPAGQPSQNTDAAQQPAQEPAAGADHAQNSNSNAGANAGAGNNAGQGSSANWSSWHSYSGSSGEQTPPQQEQSQSAGQQSFQGFGPGYGQQQAGQQPHQNAEYQWTFEDYDQIAQNKTGTRAKNSSGLKIFAVVMTVVFLITAVAFAGVLVFFTTRDGGTSETLTESSTEAVNPDGPQLSLNNRPAPDEEEYTDGVLSTEEIAAKVRPSVVGIISYQSTSFPMQSYNTGSGIIMTSDGYIITNAHVVNGAAGIAVILDNDEEYEAELVGIDEKTDLAVVKIEADNLTPAEFGNSDELVVGERIVAIGNPTGMNLAGSVTQGIVSGLERSIQVTDETTGNVIEMQAIQVDAAINPGNSGGALINKYGQVVGINSSKLSSTQIEGIGFAIPISTAKPIVDDLISYGYVRGRVLLGITYYAISDVTGAISGYTPGLWVQTVREDLDVYAKGVRPGDVIVRMDDQNVRDSDTVKAIMEGKEPGDTVKLEIVRQSVTGKVSTFTVEVELAEDTGSLTTTQQEEQNSQSQGGLQQLPSD